ncbi:hypothetical protein JD974_04320 [Chromobacterium haemolyticum]|uniref:DUF4105 domain-containing protein n=1 Tax=Chromobacterium haemolyticum TaxID=394935 RepID=A0ABS3GJG9_9NEIS|nr:hypothetical protein [Chromobacterium haemolyticum]MBK0413625.1 hypothetical protein [Chromobacterium haemolyticum]MBO0414727.1 hypothetical protein [Chromobacterium haemolyticum]MBO0497988.1 hypothetical protein [Chromobacterium haemolyticum]
MAGENASQTLKAPSGKDLFLVRKQTSTPTTNDELKKVLLKREMIEVIISDSRMRSMGSQWGHAAIVIDGQVYSRAHEEYVKTDKNTYLNGGVVQRANDTINVNGNRWRDNVGVYLSVSTREKDIVKNELERRIKVDREFKRKHPDETSYSLFSNSCSSNVADALELVNILAHDPRWIPFPVAPAELLAVIEKSNRAVKKELYPKK